MKASPLGSPVAIRYFVSVMAMLGRLILSLAAALGFAPQGAAPPSSTPVAPALKMRAKALALKPEEIGISRTTYPHAVWGLVMEMDLDGANFFTFLVLADGTVSIYISNGPVIIGAGQHEKIRTASLQLLVTANALLNCAALSNSTPLPLQGHTTFYMLVFDGLHSYSARTAALENNIDGFSGLFLQAHEVIGLIRRETPRK
jgi:hypothetical protein